MRGEPIREVIGRVRGLNLPLIAAGISFYAITSVIPLIALAMALLGALGLVELAVNFVRDYFDGPPQLVIELVLTTTRGRNAAGVIGFCLILWSGLQVFRGLVVAFGEIYDHQATISLVEKLLRSLLIFAVLVVALILITVTGFVVGGMDVPVRYPRVVGHGILLVVLVLLSVPVFYILPPISVTLRHTLPGATLTAVSWVGLAIGFSSYVQSASQIPTYGVLGGILLFVTFVYLATLLLLVGAVLNAVLSPSPHS